MILNNNLKKWWMLTLNAGFILIFFSLAFTLQGIDFAGDEWLDPLRRSGVPAALAGAERVWPIININGD